MRILWLINVILPSAAKGLGLAPGVGGSWLAGQLSALHQKPELEICVQYIGRVVSPMKSWQDGNIRYQMAGATNEENRQTLCAEILREFKPDVVHIFGTEQAQSYSMLCVALPARTLVSIQGLVYLYHGNFFDGMPEKLQKVSLAKRLVRAIVPVHGAVLAIDAANMQKAGVREKQSLSLAQHVAGRTEWDKAGVKEINPDVQYHHYGEILRPIFYQDKWDINKCKRHQIFMSQGNYPIKGLHMAIEALPMVLEKFPNAKIIVAGQSRYFFKNPFKQAMVNYLYEYQTYCMQMIRRLGLQDHVEYTGPLDEAQMCEAYLQSHLFLIPSSIENSPNSLGEAMMLGMPCVASRVGGVPDMLQHEKEGMLYEFSDTKSMAKHIVDIFSNDDLSLKLGANARERAKVTHDVQVVTKQLMAIYNLLAQV